MAISGRQSIETSGRARHPVLRAVLWMSGALASFMAMAIGARELSAELGTFEILFFRSLIGVGVLALLLQRRGWGQLRTPRFRLHLLRNTAHFAGQFGWFYGIAFLPLAEVFAIEFTVPVWTALLAAMFLGERLVPPRYAAIALGVVGTLVILQPGVVALHPAATAVLLGAVAYAISHTVTKRLTAIDTPLTILFYMTAIQLPLGLAPALAHWVTPSTPMWPWLAVVGVTALTAHYCMVRALALADVTVVVPMDFLRVPLIALVGLAFYGERLEWPVLAGAVLILAGNYINIRAERRT